MPALVAGIHVFLSRGKRFKTWMAGTSPAMTLNFNCIARRSGNSLLRRLLAFGVALG